MVEEVISLPIIGGFPLNQLWPVLVWGAQVDFDGCVMWWLVSLCIADGRSFAGEIVAMVETIGLEKGFTHKGSIGTSNTNLPVMAKHADFVGI